MGFLAYVAGLAAAIIGRPRLQKERQRQLDPKPKPDLGPTRAQIRRRRSRGFLSIEERKSLAYGAFPNHYGNYLGKRDPKPAPRPRTPEECFQDLWAMYQR